MRISDWSSGVCSSDLAALTEGGALDPMTADADAVAGWLDADATTPARRETIRLRSADPDDLTLREARWLGQADRVYHDLDVPARSEEHTSELQSLMRISYAVFCLKKQKTASNNNTRLSDT